MTGHMYVCQLVLGLMTCIWMTTYAANRTKILREEAMKRQPPSPQNDGSVSGRRTSRVPEPNVGQRPKPERKHSGILNTPQPQPLANPQSANESLNGKKPRLGDGTLQTPSPSRRFSSSKPPVKRTSSYVNREYMFVGDRELKASPYNGINEPNVQRPSGRFSTSTVRVETERPLFDKKDEPVGPMKNINSMDNYLNRLKGHIDAAGAYINRFKSKVTELNAIVNKDEVYLTYGGLDFAVNPALFSDALKTIMDEIKYRYKNDDQGYLLAANALDLIFPTWTIFCGLMIWVDALENVVMYNSKVWEKERHDPSAMEPYYPEIDRLAITLKDTHLIFDQMMTKKNQMNDVYTLIKIKCHNVINKYIYQELNPTRLNVLEAPLDIEFEPNPDTDAEILIRHSVKIAVNTPKKLRLLSTIAFTQEYIQWIDYLLNTNQLNTDNLSELYTFSRYFIKLTKSANKDMQTKTAVARDAVIKKFRISKAEAMSVHGRWKRDREIIYIVTLLKGHLNKVVNLSVDVQDIEKLEIDSVHSSLDRLKANARSRMLSSADGKYANCYFAELEKQWLADGPIFAEAPEYWDLSLQVITIECMSDVNEFCIRHIQ